MEKVSPLAKVLYHYGYLNDTFFDKTKIICPFHDDQNPSMVVDIKDASLFDKRCYCFGCGKSANALDIISLHERCDELKALSIAHSIINGQESRNVIIRTKPRLSNKQAIEEAKTYFYSLPRTDWRSPHAEQYLINRGYSPRTLSKLDARENYSTDYGVVIPMCEEGAFKGYVCRATKPSVPRKYLYNTGFSRYSTLVGSYKHPWPLITEGILDYAKALQNGHTNAVAILGWKATDYQLSKLQQRTSCVISALDNTPTGEEGTRYLKEFFHVIRFQFPDHAKDLGDLSEYEWNLAHAQTVERVKAYRIP